MEGLSKSRLLMKNEGKLSFRRSQLDDESSSGQVDSMLRCSETSGTMVRNVGTSQSFLQGTSERTNQNMLRRSFDIPSNTLNLYVNDQRSLSDSELEMTTYDVSDMSSEFLDLPTRVSVKPHSSYRHRIDPEKLYLDLKKVKLEQSRHSNTNKPSFIDAPKIEFTPVDVVIDTEVAEDNKRSDLYMDNDIDSNYEGDYVSRMSANMWINLDTPSHTLLSPRSSNGSICSYRSSNADSAIELLTPDEEMSEHSPIDLSHTKLWEEKHKPRLGKTHDIWDTTTITGAKLNSKTADTTQEDNSIHMCSQPLYRHISSSHCREDSSSALNPLLTLQINSNLANLPSKEESNKGRELLLPCPPSVVISDFSNENSSVNTSQTSSSSPHTSQSQGELLEDPSMFFHRSLSSSSISSTESFLSIQSDSSLDVDEPPEFPIKVAKKVSVILFYSVYYCEGKN